MTRICVVTGSRADYGLLQWLLHEIQQDAETALSVVATGMHLVGQYGNTWEAIEADGFVVAAKVEMLVAGDSRAAMAKSLGLGIVGMTDALVRLAPDIVVVLGDRIEPLAAAQAALILGIPVAHIHGGEISEGALDEPIRHAITKLADLHFAAAPAYAQRLIQMGEPPERVFMVGAPGLEAMHRVEFEDRNTLGCALGAPLTDPLLLVTYHPATRSEGNDALAVDALINALDELRQARVVVTGVNADSGRDLIAQRFAAWAELQPTRVTLHPSLGQRRYLSVLRLAAAVVGNSSSGIIEAPALGVPAVNIGDRQRGRLRARSVIDCEGKQGAISAALARAISAEFRRSIVEQPLPYGGGIGVGRAILSKIKAALAAGLPYKRFHDLADHTA